MFKSISSSKSSTVDATVTEGSNFAETILSKLQQGRVVVVTLQGDYGVGKTQFVKGLAAGLQVKEQVVSPSYTYIREYKIDSGMLVHVDAWRVKSTVDMSMLGIENYLLPGNVIVIEWGQLIDTQKLLNENIDIYNVSIDTVNSQDMVTEQNLDDGIRIIEVQEYEQE